MGREMEKMEIKRLLRQLAEGDRAAERLRKRNAALRRMLADISVSAAKTDGRLKDGQAGDAVGAEIARRAEIREEIRLNDAAIGRILCEGAAMERRMTECLTADERAVLLARYADGLSWTAVARKTGISRSGCFRLETAAMRKLSSINKTTDAEPKSAAFSRFAKQTSASGRE